MDLSKAFDCLNHELLIAKLSASGFSISALRLIHSYLNERKQRVEMNGSFSTWRETTIVNTLHSAFIPNIGFWRYFYITNSKTLRDFQNKQGFLRIVVGFSSK